MKRYLFSIVILAAALASCGQPPQQEPQPEQVVTTPGFSVLQSTDWKDLPNADLVTGDVRWRPNVTSFEFAGEASAQIEVVNPNLVIVSGNEAQVIKEQWKPYDLVWTEGAGLSVFDVREAPGDAIYIQTEPMVLFDYIWGDVEVDIGEAMTRYYMQKLGFYSRETGYLIDPSKVNEMTNEEVLAARDMILAAQEGTDGLRLLAAETTPEVSWAINFEGEYPPGEGNLDKIVIGIKGQLYRTVEWDAILKFRAYKENAFLWWDADFDFDSTAGDRDYDRCYSRPHLDRTCIDHVYMRYTPGIEINNLETSVQAIFQFHKTLEWKRDGYVDEALIPIPLGAIQLTPRLVLDLFAEATASAQVSAKATFNGDFELPLGLEHFGDRNYAISQCGGGDGCQPGINWLPNSARPQHEPVHEFSMSDDLVEGSVSLDGKAGYKLGIALNFGPTSGIIQLQGIKGGVKVVSNLSYQPIKISSDATECLVIDLKLVPFVSMDLKVIWDAGVKSGELFNINVYEANLTGLTVAEFKSDDVCLDAAPRDRISVRVTNPNVPEGRQDDVSGYEIDQIYAERQNEDGTKTVIKTEGALAEADGLCDLSGGWEGVEHLTGTTTYTFEEALQPGDEVVVVRVNNDQGGGCKPSGTADFYLEGGAVGDYKIATADNSLNLFKWTLDGEAFQ